MNRMKRHWANLEVPECYSPPSPTQSCSLTTSCLQGSYCMILETAGACACISSSMSTGGNKFFGACKSKCRPYLCFFRQWERGCPTGQRTDAGCKSACFTYLNTAGSVPHFTNPHIHLVSVCVCKCVLVMLRTGVKIETFIERKMYTSQLFRSS